MILLENRTETEIHKIVGTARILTWTFNDTCDYLPVSLEHADDTEMLYSSDSITNIHDGINRDLV